MAVVRILVSVVLGIVGLAGLLLSLCGVMALSWLPSMRRPDALIMVLAAILLGVLFGLISWFGLTRMYPSLIANKNPDEEP